MNLTQLRGLVAIAETGSVTAAAESLGVTQSGLSQSLAALEESLGMKLLVRHRHGVDLTAFGEDALKHAQAALAHLDAIRKGATGETPGSIRLAAFPSVFATVLPPILRRFRSLHPEVRLVALETDDREVEAWLNAGSIDLGVVLNPSPEAGAVVLGRDAWTPIVPATHHFARKLSLSLSELVAEPFVLATGGCHVNARTITQAAGLSLRDIQIEVRDWSSAIALVKEGAGISLVPESTLPEKPRGLRIVRLDPPMHRTFGLLASPTRPRSQAVRLFLELSNSLSSLPLPKPWVVPS